MQISIKDTIDEPGIEDIAYVRSMKDKFNNN